MKALFAFLFDAGRNALRLAQPAHNDSLRANQGDRPAAFSYWRALVS